MSGVKSENTFLGINVGHHDSSVCVLSKYKDCWEAEILEEERLVKKKKVGFYPYLSLQKVQEKFDINSLPPENVAFTTFFTSLEESFGFIAKSKSKYSFIYRYDAKLNPKTNNRSLNVVHHEAHLFSVMPSLDFDREHLVLIADGCGSSSKEFEEYNVFGGIPEGVTSGFETISVYLVKGNSVKPILKKFSPVYMYPPPYTDYSPSTYFSAMAEKVFGHWSHSGKVMGLAGYHEGELYSAEELFNKIIRMPKIEEKSKKDFDELDAETLSENRKLCASVQAYYEEYMMGLLKDCSDKAGSPESLVFLGGCALNCIFNEKLRKTGLFKNIYVPAQPNDEGVSLGAAIGAYYRKHGEVPKLRNPRDPFKGQDRAYSEAQIREAFRGYTVEPLEIEKVADLIASENVIAWIQGRSECGPRALGHRSIICSPFIKDIKSYLNEHIKFREAFRPYGCSVLEEEQEKFFEDAKGLSSPYMSFAPLVKGEWRERLKEITHVDGTLRAQTVTEDFGLFHRLLEELRLKAETSMVIHTSLNINKQPILESLEDAVKFQNDSKIEHMVFNGFLISRP